ncbi:histone deacetylase HDT2-like [Wolffia australiana]
MEFWGVEVKPGETVKYELNDNKYLHLSQVTLGEGKKESKADERATIFVNFDNKKLVIGTLSADKCPQISYDLVFEKDFELSHNWKNGSLFFVGYKVQPEGPADLSDEIDSESEYEDSPVAKELKESKNENGKAKSNIEKASLSSKADAKAPGLKRDEVEDEDDSDDDDDFELDDEDKMDGESESDEEETGEESSDEEDEPTPKKGGDEKKRVIDPAPKTPVPEKKAKIVAPPSAQKTGGGAEGKKGGGQPATPHPAKQAGKTPATSDKPKPAQTPKSGGTVACPSCPKTFKDENALKSHTLAKHPAQ